MAKPTEGFLAEDGTFFISEAEADLHTAEMKILAFCVTHTPVPIDSDRVIFIIEALADPIKDYLNAKDRLEEVPGQNTTITDTINSFGPRSETQKDQTDEDESREDTAAIFEQSFDGRKPMPDMGDSSSSEGIFNQRPRDGS